MHRLLVSLFALLFMVPALTRAEVTISVTSACEGDGIAGSLTDSLGSTRVFFEACSKKDTAYARIWKSSGKVMTEFVVMGASAWYLVEGVDMSEGVGEDVLRETGQLFLTPQAELVGQHLWQKLNDAGYTPLLYPGPMAALAGNLVGYETITPRGLADECFGCCGYGCTGCTGCYTQLCAQHDSCVRSHGGGVWAHVRCAYLLAAAGFSAWECV